MTVAANRPGEKPLPTELDIAKYFNGSTPGAHITFNTAEGTRLLEMKGWSMAVPNHKDGTAGVLNDKRPADAAFYQVGATFASPDDEHYYGLGQNQEGFLDHRGHTVECWNNYTATGGPTFCVPLLVTNKGYGVLWDNPSKTTIEPGFNEQTRWTSEVGDRVSFFVIAGSKTDEIYCRLSAADRARRRCCPRRLMDSSSASSATARRMRCWRWPRAIASGTCPPT